MAAAGNYGDDACLHSPGSVPSAITVGATGSLYSDAPVSDRRMAFSGYGPCVDIFAPGYQILSAGFRSDTAGVEFAGTSAATPHVTGVVALYLEGHPNATPAQVSAWLVANATRGVVQNAGAGSPNRMLYSLG